MLQKRCIFKKVETMHASIRKRVGDINLVMKKLHMKFDEPFSKRSGSMTNAKVLLWSWPFREWPRSCTRHTIQSCLTGIIKYNKLFQSPLMQTEYTVQTMYMLYMKNRSCDLDLWPRSFRRYTSPSLWTSMQNYLVLPSSMNKIQTGQIRTEARHN